MLPQNSSLLDLLHVASTRVFEREYFCSCPCACSGSAVRESEARTQDEIRDESRETQPPLEKAEEAVSQVVVVKSRSLHCTCTHSGARWSRNYVQSVLCSSLKLMCQTCPSDCELTASAMAMRGGAGVVVAHDWSEAWRREPPALQIFRSAVEYLNPNFREWGQSRRWKLAGDHSIV